MLRHRNDPFIDRLCAQSSKENVYNTVKSLIRKNVFWSQEAAAAVGSDSQLRQVLSNLLTVRKSARLDRKVSRLGSGM